MADDEWKQKLVISAYSAGAAAVVFSPALYAVVGKALQRLKVFKADQSAKTQERILFAVHVLVFFLVTRAMMNVNLPGVHDDDDSDKRGDQA